jgi:glycosyltransferase involved in cell wall biosynthesis
VSDRRPRARIYTPFFPFPFTEGSFPVIYDQARSLHELGWAVELVVWKDSPGEIARKLGAGDGFLQELRITAATGAGLRSGTAGMWRDAVGSTYEPGDAQESKVARTLRVGRSLLSRWASPEMFHYPLEADFRAALPHADLGIYHYSFAYPWLRRAAGRREARVCVHLHNLESDLFTLRAERDESQSARLPAQLHRLNARKLAAHEAALHGLVDELWFLSAVDLERYAALTGRTAGLRFVPPTFDARLGHERRRDFETNGRGEAGVVAGFVGGGYFEPNRASIEWIITRLAPALQHRGFGGRVVIAGRGVPQPLIDAARQYPFLELPGFIPSLDGFWRDLSFFLIPHVCGSGVRIKLLEALVSGVPTLATHAAVAPLAEALRADPLLHVGDAAAEWAELLVRERAAFTSRRATTPSGLRAELSGAHVYSFLCAQTGPRPSMKEGLSESSSDAVNQ